jgi:hypothetical protein
MSTIIRVRDPHAEGVVAHLSAGGYSVYHRLDCPHAPLRGESGVRDLIHGPWRYLAAHWHPCQVCRPPAGEHQVVAA